MRGFVDRVLAALPDEASASLADRVAIQLCRAELLHLDQRRGGIAVSVIDNEAVPTSRRISEEISLILERNRIDVLFGGRFPDLRRS